MTKSDSSSNPCCPVHAELAHRLLDRLDDTKRTFERVWCPPAPLSLLNVPVESASIGAVVTDDAQVDAVIAPMTLS